MTHEHHDRVVVEKDSSGYGPLGLLLSVIALLVVLWVAFGGDNDGGAVEDEVEPTSPCLQRLGLLNSKNLAGGGEGAMPGLCDLSHWFIALRRGY